MSEFFTVLWNFISGMGILGMLMIVFVIYCCLKEGLIPAAVFFAGLFFTILFFGWDKFLGEDFMVKFGIACLTGFLICFFYWVARD